MRRTTANKANSNATGAQTADSFTMVTVACLDNTKGVGDRRVTR